MITTKKEKIIEYLIIFLIITYFLFGTINFFLKVKSYYLINSYDLNLKEFQEFDLNEIDYIGTCKADSMLTSVDVYWTSDFKDGFQGLFNTELSIIILGSSNISIVTHEVSHFVDYVMYRKGINDGETRAYLQGYFTECVWRLGD